MARESVKNPTLGARDRCLAGQLSTRPANFERFSPASHLRVLQTAAATDTASITGAAPLIHGHPVARRLSHEESLPDAGILIVGFCTNSRATPSRVCQKSCVIGSA